MRFLREILFLIFFTQIIFAASNENRQNVEVVDGRNVDWLTFLKNYVLKEKPVILQKAFRHTTAYKIWSADYIKYNRGFVFFNFGAEQQYVTIRQIMKYRDIYLRLSVGLPWIMRQDLELPKSLDCDILVKGMNTPLFGWEFHNWVEKITGNLLQEEVWCSVLNSNKITLIPDWTSAMIHRYVEDVLKDQPDLEQTTYDLELRAGDCAYLPANMLRQVAHKSDSMIIIFEIDEVLKNRTKFPYETCKSLGVTKSLQKIHFGKEKDKIKESYYNILEIYLQKLGQITQCVTKEIFFNTLYTEYYTMEQREEMKDLQNEIFQLVDVDKDGSFCWADVDALNYTTATQQGVQLELKTALLGFKLLKFDKIKLERDEDAQEEELEDFEEEELMLKKTEL